MALNGEHKYPNEIEIDGRPAYRIQYITAGRDKQGKTGYVDLFSPPAQYPVLRLFPGQRGMLNAVGIDPNSDNIDAEPLYTDFYAIYEETDKAKSSGNPYKNVIDLVPAGKAKDNKTSIMTEIADNLIDIKEFLKEIRNILERDYRAIEERRNQQPPPPLPAAAPPVPQKAGNEPGLSSEEIELRKMVGTENFTKCRAILVIENTTKDRSDSTFLQAVQKHLTPQIEIRKLREFIQVIDPLFSADTDMWKPMTFAIGFYVNQKRESQAERDEALKGAIATYVTLLPDFDK